MENQIINISYERYEELIKIEARVDVLVDFLTVDKYCEKELILRILGTKESLEKADELRQEEERKLEEFASYRRKKEMENADAQRL